MKGTVTRAPTGEDWGVVASFLPENWKELAAHTGALRGALQEQVTGKPPLDAAHPPGLRALAASDTLAWRKGNT